MTFTVKALCKENTGYKTVLNKTCFKYQLISGQGYVVDLKAIDKHASDI